MSEIDANIIVEGQKTVATIPQDGEIVKDGGEIDATCIVEDSNGKKHKAVKIVNVDDEPSDKSEIDAQVLNNNNELIMVTDEQDGEIIPQNNSEIDFHCLVQKDDGKQLSVKTVELDGEIIKTGGAIDATCLVQGSNGKRLKAVKVFNIGGPSDWKGKPESWPDIRENLIPNSIRLLADDRYPLGFVANATGGYTVKIDGELKGTYASGAQCSIAQTDWPKGQIDSLTAYGATEQNGTPTPDTPMDIISNNGVLKASPNLYNMVSNPIEQGTLSSGYPAGSNYRVRTSDFINVLTGNTYTVSTNVPYMYIWAFYSDNTPTPISISWLPGSSYTFTVPSNIVKIKLVFANSTDNSQLIVPSNVSWVMLELGSTATPYTPYSPTGIYTDGTVETITDNLSNTATTEMLLKVGDYQDTQEVISGSVTRNIGIKVFNGTETFINGNNGWISEDAITNQLNASYVPFCTHFAGTNDTPQANSNTVRVYITSLNVARVYFGIDKTIPEFSSTTAFKAYIAQQYANGTPVIVVYPLATPTTETVTPQVLTGTTATVTAGSIDNLQITYTQTQGGYPIDYPTGAETAHIVDIYPTTEGNNITQFRCRRVAVSGNEEQGILWAHFNIKNSIKLSYGFYSDSTYKNPLLTACTALGNKITVETLEHAFAQSVLLEYLPKFDGNYGNIGLSQTFRDCQKLKTVLLDNMTITSYYHMCNSCYLLEDIKCKNVTANSTANTSIASAYYSCYALKEIIPTVYPSTLQRMDNYLVYTKGLEDTILDVRDATSLKVLNAYGSASYFVSGIKGVRVSSSAPFDYSTAPQINISYTGMDRSALVQLFNDLPTVTGGQIINVTGCTGANDLTDDDKAIATARGWTIAL